MTQPDTPHAARRPLDRLERFVIGFVIGYSAMTIFAAGYLAGLITVF